MTIDAAAFQPVQIDEPFRIPRQLRIAIEGEQPLQAGNVTYNKLAEQPRVCPESKIAGKKSDGRATLPDVPLTFLVPTNGITSAWA